jgi:hypothetical protein
MTTQASSISFVLDASGYPRTIPNAVAQASGNLTVSYAVSGSPVSLTILLEGLSNPDTANTYSGAQPGSPTLLDTYSSTSSVSGRSVSVSQLFDSFRVTASWTGGNNVQIAVTLSTSGASTVFTSTSLSAIQTVAGA